MTEKKGLHRGYFVFAGVCLLMAGGMGLVLNVLGNFFPRIAMHLAGSEAPPSWGPLMPSVTFMMTVYSYVMLVWLPFAGRLFDRVNGRILFGVAGIALTIATALMGTYDNIYLFYVSAGVWGLCGPILWLVGPSVLINNWFAPHKAGKFLGIASAFTGFGAFVFSPVFGELVKSMGTQAYFVEAAIAFVLIVPASIFLFDVHPSSRGLKAVGADDPEEIKDKVKVKATGGMSPSGSLKTAAFYLVFIAACIISLGGGYKSTMSSMAVQTFGIDAELLAQFTTIGAWMISAGALGNILGKIALGFLTDKIGIKVTVVAFAILAIMGFACLIGAILSEGNTILLLVGGFGVGTADALMSVGLPLVTRTVFGLKHYAKIYSFLNMGIAVLGGLGATFVTTTAELTGGYNIAYFIGIGGFVVVGIVLVAALINAKSFKAKWEE